MTSVSLTRPWLEFDLGTEMTVLSWALHRPGYVRARRILWREVRNADLPVDLDVHRWFAEELATREASDAVGFLTSRDIGRHHRSTADVDHVRAEAVATVGLSNAERVGYRVDRSAQNWGTVNVALCVNTPLNETGLLEALSVVVQARTAAIIDAGHRLPTGIATGTGTDCIAVAAPAGDASYAGLHTDLGAASGRAVYDAVSCGVAEWVAETGGVEYATS